MLYRLHLHSLHHDSFFAAHTACLRQFTAEESQSQPPNSKLLHDCFSLQKFLPAIFAESIASFRFLNSLTGDVFLIYCATALFDFLVCSSSKCHSSILVGKFAFYIFITGASYLVKQ